MDMRGYRNQQHAAPMFRAGLAELCRVRGLRRPHIVDFASSYGVVTALMKHRLSLEDLFARYRTKEIADMPTRALIAADSAWLAARRDPAWHAWVTAIEVAPRAAAYGRAAGLFDAAFVENLNLSPPSAALATALSQTDIIVECGSVAQLMPQALDRMLTAAAPRRPWVMASPVRGNETAEAQAVLERHGLLVETAGGPFVHRRCEDNAEAERAAAQARAAGHDTRGLEDEGFLMARLLIARPHDEATGDIIGTPSWGVDPPPAATV
ncbi:hypothetical protein [Roseovarius salinarum]|uniref:hypothetical protein n=1 Tax=Roseovarius salinarum TaxID=1981892 RepID=UPI0013000214|nr:hypothetical protein [Roseovarius salinarum]